MIRKGQARWVAGDDLLGQIQFIDASSICQSKNARHDARRQKYLHLKLSTLPFRFYRVVAPAFFAAAQRAFASADSLFRAAGLIAFRAGAFLAGDAAFFGDLSFCFAHRSFIASDMRLRAAGLIVRRFGLFAAVVFFEPAGLPGPLRAGWEPSPKRAAIAFSIRLASSLSCVTMP